MLDGPKPSPWIKNRNFCVYPHTFHLPHRKHLLYPVRLHQAHCQKPWLNFWLRPQFHPHISKPVQPCSLDLRTISKIKPVLPQSHVEKKKTHSLIFSILDCCVSLLSGDINNKSLPGFQLFQNAAARLQTGFKRQDHITHFSFHPMAPGKF